MIDHPIFKVNWFHFPDTDKPVKGVYMLAGCYIGASMDIEQRVIRHLHMAFKRPEGEKHFKIKEMYETYGYVSCYLLDDNPFNERIYIEKCDHVYNSENGRTYEQMYKNKYIEEYKKSLLCQVS